jgi:phosphoserine phosphatase RsbU/P
LTSKTRQATAPEWKQFLRLGEQLSNQPDTASQCALITKTVQGRLVCHAEVILMEPYYPLPGETEVNIIPQTSLKNLEKKVNDFRHLQRGFTSSSNLNKDKPLYSRIIPIQTQNDLLGVLYVERHTNDFLPEDLDFLTGFAAHAAVAMQITRQIVIKNWRSEQLALVQSVSENIANIFDLDQLCQQVTQLIQKTFHYYHVGIYTLEEQHENLLLRASADLNISTEYTPSFAVKIGEGIIGNVAQTGLELLARNVREESHYRYIDALPETQSEYALPLKIEEKILGILDVQSDRVNSFHEIDQLVLRSLANNIALAIENGSLYNRARQRAEQISLVIDFNHALSSILDLEELVAKVVQLIQERFGYPYVHYFSIQPVRRKIQYETGSGATNGIYDAQKLSFDLDDTRGIIPKAAREGKSILTNDVRLEELYRDNPIAPTGTRSELAVPVIFAGTVLGVLDIQSDQLNAFNENDLSIIEALAASIAIAVRNASLYRSEKWRVQVADSFRDVAQLMSSNATLDDLLGSILDKLESNLPCEASAIWLVEEPLNQNHLGSPSLKLAAVRGIEAEKIDLALEDHEIRDWLSKAMTNQEPTIRTPSDPYGPLGKALDFPPEYSSIGAPLRSGDQPLGILTLAHHTTGRYGSEAHDMVITFASYAAISIENARLFADAQEQAWVSTVLLQVAEASQALASTEELLDTMVRLPPLLIGVKLCAFYLWDDAFQGYSLKSSYGMEDLDSSIIYYENETPAFARLNSTRSATIIEDPAEELKIPSEALPSENLIFTMLPLLSRGNLLGGFFVGYRPAVTPGEEPLSQQIIAILQGISHQAATALENLRLEEAREEEAYVTAVLLEVAQAVVSQNDLSDILDTVIHLLPILVGIDTCIIYTWDQENGRHVPIRAFSDSTQEETALLNLQFL